MGLRESFRNFTESSRRVFTVSKKPSWNEFSTMVKIILAGVALIGVISYIIYLIFTLTGLGR